MTDFVGDNDHGDTFPPAEVLFKEILELRKQRDEARLQTGRILNEIDCRIEHGADSNGHLEAIYSMFRENNNA